MYPQGNHDDTTIDEEELPEWCFFCLTHVGLTQDGGFDAPYLGTVEAQQG